MKLHFEPDLDYQKLAIESVADLFRGQEINRTEFTVTADRWRSGPGRPASILAASSGAQGSLASSKANSASATACTCWTTRSSPTSTTSSSATACAPSTSLASGDFTVEMETGTGKTYVYLRTIFELNRRYGFTKFVIVVPSVAIKEGVYKTLQITEEHFRGLYANAALRLLPLRLHQARAGAQLRHQPAHPDHGGDGRRHQQEGRQQPLQGQREDRRREAHRPDPGHPADPDRGRAAERGRRPAGAGKKALGAMNPLCTLRYSATHADKHHMVYRLDAVDAYERKLVKQIEVASLEVEGGHNKPYVRFVSASNGKGPVTARVELDVRTASGVRRKEVIVQDGDDLEELTRRAVYDDCRVGEIRAAKGKEFWKLRCPAASTFLKLGQAYGDVDAAALQREMIRRTIKEHLDKELRLAPQGIKVLSLFFIDAVERYRQVRRGRRTR